MIMNVAACVMWSRPNAAAKSSAFQPIQWLISQSVGNKYDQACHKKYVADMRLNSRFYFQKQTDENV